MNWEAIGAVGGIMAAMFFTPGGRRFWQEVKHLYAGSQAQALDARIARGQLHDIRSAFLIVSNGDKANESEQDGSH